jgi:hypothetical protein
MIACGRLGRCLNVLHVSKSFGVREEVAMRRMSRLLVGLGAVLLVLAGLWALVVPSAIVKLPGDLDLTAHVTGSLTRFADASTGTALPTPSTAPVEVRRRLHVVSSSSDHAVVQVTATQLTSGQSVAPVNQQYVLDRKNSRNLQSDQSWAYSPGNRVNRAPFWSVNLPFGTDEGPYQVWNDEIGAPVQVAGTERTRVEGVALHRLQGQVTNTPAQVAFLKQLGVSPTGTISPQQVGVLLKLPVYDPTITDRFVIPLLSSADAAELKRVQSVRVPLHYQVDIATTLLVDPRTGLICDTQVNDTLYAIPDLAGVRQLLAVFSQPKYASNEVTRDGATFLTNVLAHTPRLQVLNTTYQQTPSSVAQFVSYAKSKGDRVDLVKHTVPLVLLVAGIVVLVAGLLVGASAGSRKPPAPLVEEAYSADEVDVMNPARSARGNHRKPARHGAEH